MNAEKTESQLLVVQGFVPDVDYENLHAKRLGLEYRLALVVIIYDPSDDDVDTEQHIIRALDTFLSETVSHDSISIKAADGKILFSMPEYLEMIKEPSPTGSALCVDMTFTMDGHPVGYVNILPYVAIGGPMPYHDSITYECFFRDELEPAKLMGAIPQFCHRLGMEFEGVIRNLGSARISFKQRMRDCLFRLFH